MTSAQPVPGEMGAVSASGPGSSEPSTAKENQALVQVTPMPAGDSGLLSGPVSRLPVELDVVVQIEEFRVRDLLALEPGKVIASRWSSGDDVPLAAGDVQLAWSEFEVIDGQLGVRITRLP